MLVKEASKGAYMSGAGHRTPGCTGPWLPQDSCVLPGPAVQRPVAAAVTGVGSAQSTPSSVSMAR